MHKVFEEAKLHGWIHQWPLLCKFHVVLGTQSDRFTDCCHFKWVLSRPISGYCCVKWRPNLQLSKKNPFPCMETAAPSTVITALEGQNTSKQWLRVSNTKWHHSVKTVCVCVCLMTCQRIVTTSPFWEKLLHFHICPTCKAGAGN